VTARDYIEAIAAKFSRLRGRGLLLSPADAGLALAWHAAGVPLRDVQAELRRAGRLKPRAVRGAAEVGLSLQIIAGSIDSRRRAATRTPAGNPPAGLCAELLRAARLAARAAWPALAARAKELLASGGEGYWTEALAALGVVAGLDAEERREEKRSCVA
jgi:hypothetical protein